MIESFWSGHMDFIFFLYGLSFLILAGVCFSSLKYKKDGLPWFFLGMFGLLHGFNEILDMFVIGLGDVKVFTVVRLLFLVSSYVFLCEFARVGFSRAGQRKIRWWVYCAPCVVIGVGGFLYGYTGINVAARYTLGFPGALGVSLVLLLRGQQFLYRRSTLAWLAISFGVYGIASGLVVPTAPYWPASVLNYDSFMKVFHFPVQVVRSLCAVSAAAAVWYNATYQRGIGPQRVKGRVSFYGNSHSIVGMLLCIVCAGWYATEYLGAYMSSALHSESQTDIRVFSHHLKVELESVDNAVLSLRGSAWIAPALTDPSAENIEKANNVLDRYAGSFNLSVAYLMDKAGGVVASSNRDTPNSFVGKSYAFRPYFQSAIKGAPGRYLALGVTTLERGYYTSAPVLGGSGEVVGVVVGKSLLDKADVIFAHFDPFYIISPEGVIFLTNRREHLLKSLWPHDAAEEVRIVASKQFGPGPFPAVFSGVLKDGSIISDRGHKAQVVEHAFPLNGWKIVLLHPWVLVGYYRLFSICVTLLLCMALLFFFTAIRQNEEFVRLMMLEKEKAQQYLDIAGVLIIVLDKRGAVSMVNKRGVEIIGYEERDILGKNWFELCIPVATRESVKEMYFSAMENMPIAEYYENPIITRSGSIRLIAWHNVVLRDEKGQVVGSLSSGEDITIRAMQEDKLKAAYAQLKDAQQELLQSGKMSAMGQMAAGVSHELNQPLTGIKGFAQSVLSEMAQTDPLRADIQKIVEQADRMDSIIKNVRFFARKSEFAIEDLDAVKVIDNSLSLLQEQLKVENISVAREFSGVIPRIAGDANQMQQVFLNMLTNARDALAGVQRPSGKTITISITAYKNGSCVKITIADNGCGISKESLEHIFNPFYTTKSPNGGMGLGLAIVYRIIESHKGTIAVESVPGEGTTFTVVLPASYHNIG